MRILEERKEYSLYYWFESRYDLMKYWNDMSIQKTQAYLRIELRVDHQVIIDDSIQIKSIPVSYESDDNIQSYANIKTSPHFDKKLKILSNRVVKKFKALKRRK